MTAASGSAAADAHVHRSAFDALPVAAKIGDATAIPSGMLCSAMASATATPRDMQRERSAGRPRKAESVPAAAGAAFASHTP